MRGALVASPQRQGRNSTTNQTMHHNRCRVHGQLQAWTAELPSSPSWSNHRPAPARAGGLPLAFLCGRKTPAVQQNQSLLNGIKAVAGRCTTRPPNLEPPTNLPGNLQRKICNRLAVCHPFGRSPSNSSIYTYNGTFHPAPACCGFLLTSSSSVPPAHPSQGGLLAGGWVGATQ